MKFPVLLQLPQILLEKLLGADLIYVSSKRGGQGINFILHERFQRFFWNPLSLTIHRCPTITYPVQRGIWDHTWLSQSIRSIFFKVKARWVFYYSCSKDPNGGIVIRLYYKVWNLTTEYLVLVKHSTHYKALSNPLSHLIPQHPCERRQGLVSICRWGSEANHLPSSRGITALVPRKASTFPATLHCLPLLPCLHFRQHHFSS